MSDETTDDYAEQFNNAERKRIKRHARVVAVTIQTQTKCSEASMELLTKCLSDFAEEIKRQAIEL